MERRVRNAIVASIAAAVLAGFGTIGVSASHSGGGGQGGGGTSSATCALSPATVGGPLTITGQGFKPGGSYALDVTWPYGGSGYLFATADSSGDWSVYTTATWSGTYNVEVLSSKGAVLATCSETVS